MNELDQIVNESYSKNNSKVHHTLFVERRNHCFFPILREKDRVTSLLVCRISRLYKGVCENHYIFEVVASRTRSKRRSGSGEHLMTQ